MTYFYFEGKSHYCAYSLLLTGARLSAKANITLDKKQLIVKGNEFHYLGFNGFRL
jgi:hypothetical protein